MLENREQRLQICPLLLPFFIASCHMHMQACGQKYLYLFLLSYGVVTSCCASGSVFPIPMSGRMPGFGQAVPVEAAKLGGTLCMGAVPASGAAGCGCPHASG